MQVLKVEGAIDIDCVLEQMQRIYRSLKSQRWLVDMSTANVELSGDQARLLGQEIRRHHEKAWQQEQACHVALVAEDDLTYGLMRVVKGHADLAEQLNVEVYRAAQEAENWLAAA